jgi:hypothetical protein
MKLPKGYKKAFEEHKCEGGTRTREWTVAKHLNYHFSTSPLKCIIF